MSNFSQIAENTPEGNFKEIYKKIAGKYSAKGINDSLSTMVNFSTGDIAEIKELQYEEVKSRLVEDGVSFCSFAELKKDVEIDVKAITSRYVKDGFYNPITNIGTQNDPGSYNSAFTPVSMSPMEASSYYGSRGIGSLIIDKKSKVSFINGYQFSDGLDPDDLKKLLDYSKQVRFDESVIAATRDGLIYGGSSIVPVLKNDTFGTYPMSIDELLTAGILDTNSIDYFFTVDRWNMIVVPSMNLTARDYLMPKFFYIPIGSMKIATTRACIIKPYPLPYWVAIRQLGWSVSDYEGFVRSLLGYNMIIASIPIMAQQMSLLIHEMPLDGILAQNGPEYTKQFIIENEAQLRSWSMANPKAINSFGKISVIERSYAGFRELIETYREDVGANAGMPVSSIFYLQPQGLSAGNTEDLTLKQSESIKMLETNLRWQLKPAIEMMVVSCFGANSPQAKNRKLVNIDFNSPYVISNIEKADTGTKFTQSLSALIQNGIPTDVSINMLRQFFPDFEIEKDDYDKLVQPSENEVPGVDWGTLNTQKAIQ